MRQEWTLAGSRAADVHRGDVGIPSRRIPDISARHRSPTVLTTNLGRSPPSGRQIKDMSELAPIEQADRERVFARFRQRQDVLDDPVEVRDQHTSLLFREL